MLFFNVSRSQYKKLSFFRKHLTSFIFFRSSSLYPSSNEEASHCKQILSLRAIISMSKEEKAMFLQAQRRDDYLAVRDLIKPRGIYVKRIRTVCLRSQTELPPRSWP